MAENATLETGIDQLAKLLDKNNRISIKDAATRLKTGNTLIEEWAKLLEKEGFLDIEYHFTNPFLVRRLVSKEDVENKIQEFHVRKDTFVRKGELMISQMEQQGINLSKIKEEFGELKKQHKKELEKIKVEVEELEKCKQEKEELRTQIFDQRKSLLKEADYIKHKIHKENENYSVFSTKLKKELKDMRKKKSDLTKFGRDEKKLFNEINKIKQKIGQFNTQYANKLVDVKDSESKVQDMQELLKEMSLRMETEKDELTSVTKSNDEKEKEIAKMEENVVKKLQEQKEKLTKDTAEGEKTYNKFKTFFKKRTRIEQLLEKTLADREELERTLNELVAKAKALGLMAKSSKLKKDVFVNEIAKLEKNFKEIDKKRGFFHKEVKKFLSLIKK
ncbi:hypothetical protein KY331_03770 [Candidatus Woesearchaeota archaeon]|nr:hypothetical protein [Candidatus Woesearchaeota archaeon]